MTLHPPNRFYSLDFIRGLAALSVVFWHWQHFFYEGTQGTAYRMADQPFYDVFFLLYQSGWLAVDFFFSLSGFIFFALYQDTIAGRRIGAWKFFVLRFSRLYPLHLATFALVLVLQYGILAQTGSFFVYAHNDAYHALLNLLLVPTWGFEAGWSFNAPIWSVSIEVLLYAVFFLSCRYLRMRGGVIAALLIAGWVLQGIHEPLGRGLFSFFMGGVAYHTYRWLLDRKSVRA